MEPDVLKETVKELDQSAKLIRDLVSDLIKLRRSLLKAYSGLSKLVEEPELLKPAAPLPSLSTPPSPPTPIPQQAEIAPPSALHTTTPPLVQPQAKPSVTSITTPSAAPPTVKETAAKGEMSNFVVAFSESVKSDPHVSNVIKKLSEFREKIEKKYVYHPILSEVKLVVSKFQGIPEDSVLSEDDVNKLLEKLSDWVSRLS